MHHLLALLSPGGLLHFSAQLSSSLSGPSAVGYQYVVNGLNMLGQVQENGPRKVIDLIWEA